MLRTKVYQFCLFEHFILKWDWESRIEGSWHFHSMFPGCQLIRVGTQRREEDRKMKISLQSAQPNQVNQAAIDFAPQICAW